LVVGLDNVNEGSHDLGEENDSHQHENDSNQLLISRDGVVITVSNGGKGGKSKVADNDGLSHERLLAIRFYPLFVIAERVRAVRNAVEVQALLCLKQSIHLEKLNEGCTVLYIFLSVHEPRQQPPEAANEVRYHENNDNEPEDLVGVHHNVETLESVSPGGILIVTFDDPLESTGVEDSHELGQPHESNHPGVLGLCIKDNIKGEGGHEVQQHPSALEVPYRNLLVIPHLLEGLLVLVFANEIEYKV
jgi:hypothetical protein